MVWQKVPGGKSAGRVQSPAVRLLVEREREIGAFESNAEFKVTAVFVHNEQEFKAELIKLCWFMRGGLTYDQAMALGIQERELINDLIKDNLETTKKTNMPFF